MRTIHFEIDCEEECLRGYEAIVYIPLILAKILYMETEKLISKQSEYDITKKYKTIHLICYRIGGNKSLYFVFPLAFASITTIIGAMFILLLKDYFKGDKNE